MATETETKPDLKVVARPSVRNSISLTPTTVTAAEQAAERGDLSQAAQIVDRLLTDDVIRGALDARILALLGSDQVIRGSVEKELREDLPRMLQDSELTAVQKWGLMLGVCPTQNVWSNDPAVWPRAIPQVQQWPAHNLKWDWDKSKWTSKNKDGQEIELVQETGRWGFFTPHGPFRPWANGLWRNLVLWYMLKQYAISDWGVHSEKAATLVITTPVEGIKQEDRDALAVKLFARGKNTSLALPAGCDLKIVELTANTEAIYGKQIAMANDGIAIAIRGGNLTTHTSGGSFAAASVQAGVETSKVRSDARALSTWLSADVFSWWLRFNFAGKSDASLTWRVGSDADRLARATTLQTWANALKALSDLGLEIDPAQLEDELGIQFKPRV